MKRIALLLTLVATIGGVIMADVQQGYVRTIKRPGKKAQYVEDVQITVRNISGSFRSKKKGRFELELRPLNLKAGSPFYLKSVFKPGYELYDNSYSRVYSPGVPIEIVLKDVGQEAKDQIAFARNMYKGSEANYKRKISRLETQLKEGRITEEKYREELSKYQELFDRYQSQIDVIAKRYAGLDYEHIDPLTEAINVAFGNGDFQLADSLLNTVGSISAKAQSNIEARGDIEKKIEFGKQIVEEGKREQTQNREDAERLAELAYAKHLSFLNDFQNDSAAYYLELRANLVPDNWRYRNEAGTFVLEYLADYDKASRLLNEALEILRSQNGEGSNAEAEVYNSIVFLNTTVGKYAEALEMSEKALSILAGLSSENSAEAARSYNNISMVLRIQGKFDEALDYSQKALKITEELYGEIYPDLAAYYNNMGIIYRNMGRYSESLSSYEKALKILYKLYGESHPLVATCYGNIGNVYNDTGNYSKAMDFMTKALQRELAMYGETHPNIANDYSNIATVYGNLGRYREALDNFQKALKIAKDTYGSDHLTVALIYNNIGNVHAIQRNYQEALKDFEEALRIQKLQLDESSPDIALSYNNIGTVYAYQVKLEEALSHFEKALQIRLNVYGEKHPDVAKSYNNIAGIYEKQEKYYDALINYEKSLKSLIDIFGEIHPDVATVYNNIGLLYGKSGMYTKALQSFDKVLKIQKAVFGDNHPAVIETYQTIYNTFIFSGLALTKQIAYDIFMSDLAFTATIESSASKHGISGEYYLLEFGDWNQESRTSSLFGKNEELKGKPKRILTYKDGKIEEYRFDNAIGIQLGLRYIGKEEKRKLNAAYANWRASCK